MIALAPLEPESIRARRRPVAIVGVWLWEIACAFVIATPVHAWAKRIWGAHPDGDAVLFRPPGRELVAWVLDGGPALPIVIRTTILLLFVSALASQVVLGALVASLATARPDDGRTRFGAAMGVGFAAFFPLSALTILAATIEGMLLAAGYFAGSALDHALDSRLGDARAFTVRLVTAGVFVVLALIVGVIADLARVAIARNIALATERRPALVHLRDGLFDALGAAYGSVLRATVAWGWRAAIATALIVLGAILGTRFAGAGGAALTLLFVLHQAFALARVALRTSWLANALRIVVGPNG